MFSNFENDMSFSPPSSSFSPATSPFENIPPKIKTSYERELEITLSSLEEQINENQLSLKPGSSSALPSPPNQERIGLKGLRSVMEVKRKLKIYD